MDKRISYKDKQTAQAFMIVFLTVVLCVVAYLFLDAQLKQTKVGMIQAAALDNAYIAGQMVTKLQENAQSHEDMIRLISEADSDGQRYWMLFSAEEILFEKNVEFSEVMTGMSYVETADYYQRSGGHQYGMFLDRLRQGERFSASVIKNVSVGTELISVEFFTFEGQNYAVAVSSLQSVYFSRARVGERDVLVRLVFFLVAGACIGLSAAFSVDRRNKQIQIRDLSAELHRVNRVLIDETGDSSGNDAGPSVRNALTHLYSASFFDVVLDRIQTRSVKDIGVIILRVENYYGFKKAFGEERTNQIFVAAADVLTRNSQDKDMCFQTRSNEFVILKIQTSSVMMKKQVKKIFTEMKRLDSKLELFGGYIKRDSADSMDMALKAAYASMKRI